MSNEEEKTPHRTQMDHVAAATGAFTAGVVAPPIERKVEASEAVLTGEGDPMQELVEETERLGLYELVPLSPENVRGLIVQECRALEAMLVDKNRKYGNSALDPVRIMSRASPVEQLKVRIDDKLSRLLAAAADEDEDVVRDILGYFILLRVAQRLEQAQR